MSKDIKELIQVLALAFCLGGTVLGVAGFTYKGCTENRVQEEKSFQACVEKHNPCDCSQRGEYSSSTYCVEKQKLAK